MIEWQQWALYHGPNPFAMDAVVVVGMHSPAASVDLLLQAVPALQSQTADWLVPVQSPTGLPPQLQLGAFLADWALQAQTFKRGFLHAAGCVPQPNSGGSMIWVGFHDPRIAWEALCLGAQWLAALAEQRSTAEYPALLDELWAACGSLHPDYQSRIVMEAARKRDIPYTPAWGTDKFWRYGHGARSRVLFESSSCEDSHFGSLVSSSKAWTKSVLRALGIPTPAYALVGDETELDAAVKAVGFPCVTKPIHGGGGKGVTAGLTDLAMVRDGFSAARAYRDGPVMVEKHVDGEDHRLMVVDGRFAATIRREPAFVVGDGARTISDLVAAKNIGRDSRSLVRSSYQRPIKLDASSQLHLRGMGLGPDSVPAAGQSVRIRSNSNLSTGGTCVDVTEQTHPAIRSMAEAVARTLNLPMLGLDFLTTDVSQDPASSGGQFNEINVVPGLEAMVVAGWPVERAGDLALGATPGRIPVDLLIVEDGAVGPTADTAQLQILPPDCGWATWDRGAHAAAALMLDTSELWAGVRALMGHRNLSRAVVIASDRQIVEHGLPLDRFTAAHLACTLHDEWLRVVRACSDRVETYRPDTGAPDWPQRLVASLI